MQKRRVRRAATAALALLITLPSFVGGATRAAAATPSDLFSYDSLGDPIGKGGTLTLTDANATFDLTTNPGYPGSVEVQVYLGTDQPWFLTFAPHVGDVLAVGTYVAVPGSVNAYGPTIQVTGNGSGCDISAGSFDIAALTADGAGNWTSVALTFSQTCAGYSLPLIGEVRVNSAQPLASLTLPHTTQVVAPEPETAFDPVIVGQAAPNRRFTMTADGDLPVAIGTMAFTGPQAADFTLANDGCSGQLLTSGDSCSFDVVFAPTGPAVRLASLTIPTDLPLSPTLVGFIGTGRAPTTTTITAIGPGDYNGTPGVMATAVVTPSPGGGELDCEQDGTPGFTGYLTYGTGSCTVPRLVGTHSIQVAFRDQADYVTSSTTTTYTASPTTMVALDVEPGAAAAGLPITATATVSTLGGLLYPGGSLTIRNATAGTTVAVVAIDAGHASAAATLRLAAGTYQISAAYDGIAGVLDPASASVNETVAGGIIRLSGPGYYPGFPDDRYATAAAISKATFAPGVAVVYITSGLNFPDGLAGGAAAGHVGGPLLLVNQAVPAVTAAELTRLQPAQIIVLGGQGAVSNAVKSALAAFTTGAVIRLDGPREGYSDSRYGTAAAISKFTYAPGVPFAFIASGLNFPDALAGSAAAGHLGAPLLLIPGYITLDVQNELRRLHPAQIVVLGGPHGVPPDVLTELGTYTAIPNAVTREDETDFYPGYPDDRYATAAAVSKASFGAHVDVAYIASGLNYPDALGGSAAAGYAGGPLLLVNGTIPPVVAAESRRLDPSRIVVLGGRGAVSDTVLAALTTYVRH
ncbi:MAG TPA: cell wall-binding repeat-containing protein [Candidatus Limnocylindrales bacterium]